MKKVFFKTLAILNVTSVMAMELEPLSAAQRHRVQACILMWQDTLAGYATAQLTPAARGNLEDFARERIQELRGQLRTGWRPASPPISVRVDREDEGCVCEN